MSCSTRLLAGASSRNRTSDTRIFSPLLYRLSYRGKIMATRKRLELSTSSVTGWRSNQLSYRAINLRGAFRLWWAFTDLNRGPTGYEPVALTAALMIRMGLTYILYIKPSEKSSAFRFFFEKRMRCPEVFPHKIRRNSRELLQKCREYAIIMVSKRNRKEPYHDKVYPHSSRTE